MTAHRPWAVPPRPWLFAQTWHDLLFMHWPLPPDAVRAHVPGALPLDTFDGQAWVGVIPFRMTGIRFRLLPALPGTRAFCELNARTYVTVDDKPGVYFFSLDAANTLAVLFARAAFHLPYRHARMSLEDDGDWISYESRGAGDFEGRYRPRGAVYGAQRGDLDHWLTERYCLYACKGTRVWRGDIDHAPWPLQPAEAEIATNTIAPMPLPDTPPLLHFARRLDARVWAPRRI